MKIVITQRADNHVSYNERRDGLDQNWYSSLKALLGSDITLFPIPNDATQLARFLAQIDPNGIVLTGGNDHGQIPGGTNVDAGRDAVEAAVLNHAKGQGLSVLAVCRGFQFLNIYAGGLVGSVSGHVAAPHELRANTAAPFIVNSFHNHAITVEGLARDLQALAWDAEGHVEAAHHRSLPWLGIMWHPERAQPGPEAQMWLRDHLQTHTQFLD